MTARDCARHRAAHRPATALSQVAGAMTGQMSTIGRGGVVIAMSSGLVASLGLPASAATTGAQASGVTGHRAGAPLVLSGRTAPLSVGSPFAAAPAPLADGAAVVAPATATVSFDQRAFTAVPKALETRRQARASRSQDRSSGSTAPSDSTAGAPVVGGSSVIAIAARYVGIPYRSGGTTPAGFDCSGYTQYVYAQLGISLPRTSGQQYGATQRISRSAARPGDLVFVLGGGGVSHVGIYAGGNLMYDSPRTGKSVSKREIWSSDIAFGRVTG